MSTDYEEIDLIDKMLQELTVSDYHESLPVEQSGQVLTISSGLPAWVTSSAANNTINWEYVPSSVTQVRPLTSQQLEQMYPSEWGRWLAMNGQKQNIVGIQEPELTHYNFFKKLKLIK